MSDESDTAGVELVYVPATNTGSPNDVYHTDPDCVHLKQARKVHKYPRASLEGWRRECKRCAGDTSASRAYDGSHQAALNAAAREADRHE